MNNEAIRAEYGKPMALTGLYGANVAWDGERLVSIGGRDLGSNMMISWICGHGQYFTFTPEAWVRVLPPLERESPEPISASVGMEVDAKAVGYENCVTGPITAINGETISIGPFRFKWARLAWRGVSDEIRDITHKGRPVVLPSLSDKPEACQVSLSNSDASLSGKQPKIEAALEGGE